VAVASAGLYASLHLAPARRPCQHPTTQFFTDRMPFLPPTNSVKALKANFKHENRHKSSGYLEITIERGGGFKHADVLVQCRRAMAQLNVELQMEGTATVNIHGARTTIRSVR